MKDDSFKPPDEEGIKDDDEEKRKRMQEDYSVATSYDKDGQPLFKVMQKAISAKQTAKFGSQAKNEGIKFLQQTFENTTNFISYVRGKSGVVEVFDTTKDQIVTSKSFSKCFESKNSEIKGLFEYGDSTD